MNKKDYIIQEYQAAYEIAEKRCGICGKTANQIAHMIPQRKQLLDRFGWQIIFHRSNLFPVCGLACNKMAELPPCEFDNHALEVMEQIFEINWKDEEKD